jgi:hypothetical protein
MMRRLAMFAFVVIACTRTNAALLDPSVHLAKTCADGIELYTSPAKAPAGYQEVALLNSTGSTSFTSEAGMMKSMRKKAAEMGATGVILGGIDEPGAGAKVAGALLGTGTERKGKAVAIYSADDTAKVNRVCAQK